MKRLAIIGSGVFGQQIAHHAIFDQHYEVAGFFDDFEENNTVKNQFPILGGIKDIMDSFGAGHFDVLLIGIGYKHMTMRNDLYEKLQGQIPFGSIVHSSCFIDETCKIGEGSIIYPGCILDMNVEIGKNVLINIGCKIAHDSKIGDHSFVSPGVTIAGFVEIEKSVNLGIGTIIIDNVKINGNVRTGAGAVIINNLNKSGLYLGVPAQYKKT